MRWIFVGASTIASQYMLGAVRAQGDDVAWVVSGSSTHGAQWAKDHNIAQSTTDLSETLAVALAVRESAASGQSVEVAYGGVS